MSLTAIPYCSSVIWNNAWALARWLGWLEHRPIHWKAASSVLVRAHTYVVGSVPGCKDWNPAYGNQLANVSLSHWCFISLSVSLSPLHPPPMPLPLSLWINKRILRWEFFFKLPWLMWLSVLSNSQQTKGSPVQFPVRAHAWVMGQVSSRGRLRGNHTLMFLSLSFSLLSLLSKNK